MKELQKNVVDLDTALSIAPGDQDGIQDLSNMLQTTFRVPLGILVQSDPLWMKTESAGFWKYSDEERKQWCLEMPEIIFGEWQRMIVPLCEHGLKRQRKEITVDERGVKRICEYIWANPGKIFAIRTASSQWHHPSCHHMERLYGGDIYFRDLMGTFSPLSPEYHEMWKSLISASTCCGSIWVSSILHYAEGEVQVPPTMRLMTVQKMARVCEEIESKVIADEAANEAQAYATYETLKDTDPWMRHAQLVREEAVCKRLYHGDVFQPRLFNELAESLGILHKRKHFEPRFKGLLFGSQEPDEKDDN